MDAIDRRILRELSRDGRISNQKLSERVGLSSSACLRRVQALERAGILAGYRAVLNPSLMGVGFIAYVAIGLNDHSAEALQAVEQACARTEEVVECHNVTGAVCYLLRIEAADIEAYKRIHTQVLAKLPMVAQMTTHVVLGSPKSGREPFVPRP